MEDKFLLKYGQLSLKFFNEKGFLIREFIDSINKDLLKKISKYREFIIEKNGYDFYCNIFFIKNDGVYRSRIILDLKKGLEFDENYFNEILIYGGFRNFFEEDDELEFFNGIVLDSIVVQIRIDKYKLEHKEKFYKDLYDDLMAVTWHPSRYLDWCIDFEELKFLEEEVFGEED